MREAGLDDVPVVVGGIIPPEDAETLEAAGVAAVYTPKDFELNRIMADMVRIVESQRRAPADSAASDRATLDALRRRARGSLPRRGGTSWHSKQFSSF